MRHTLNAAILVFAAAALAPAQPRPLPPEVRRVVDPFKGELYFAAKNLKTGETIRYRADEKVQTASVIKVPILVELFSQAHERRLSLGEYAEFSEGNRVGGSGILKELQIGLRLTLRDVATLMIALSDNSATNMLIDRLGIASVNARMRQLGLRQTILLKKVFKPAPPDTPPEEQKYGLGVTTPNEMLALMEKIYRREVADRRSCDDMLAILKTTLDREKIPRYLAGPRWEKIEFAHKTGALDQVRNDVGVVFTPAGDFILSLFAQESADRKWTPDNEASLVLGRLSLEILSRWR